MSLLGRGVLRQLLFRAQGILYICTISIHQISPK